MRRTWRSLGRKTQIGVLLALAALLSLGALAVLSAVAGSDAMLERLRIPDRGWLAVAVAAETLAFLAYVFAYRFVARFDDGPRISLKEAAEVVVVGFGAVVIRGGAALDDSFLRRAGAEKEEAKVRVLALDALEHAPLAPAAFASSVWLLARGDRKPGLDFTIPWACLVPVGAALALWGVRHRARFAGCDGLRGHLGNALEAIHVLLRLLARPRKAAGALAASTAYWLGDVACLWAALRPFHADPALPALVIAHAVGYTLTRRTLPLAGAGIVDLLLPLTLTAGGAPLSGAILGVLVYRLCNLWLPTLPALFVLPRVRRLGDDSRSSLDRKEPALRTSP